MKKRNKSRGNTLALTVACVALLVLVIAFFALNYGSFFGVHKQAATAADAAALQAAIDVGMVALGPNTLPANLDYFGQVGLVDYSAGAPNHPANSQFNNGQGLNVAQPVVSINSLTAAARLAVLIANDINVPMLRNLAQQDLVNIQLLSARLNQRIQALLNQTGGNSIRARALATYTQNNLRSGRGRPIANLFRVQIGTLASDTSNAVITNIRIPTGADANAAPPNSQNGFYRAFLNIPAGAVSPIVFVASSNEPRLVEHRNFRPNNFTVAGITVAGSVVRVTSTDEVQRKESNEVQRLTTMAAAHVGGQSGTTKPTTVFTLGFSGGFPNIGPALSVSTLMNFNGWANNGGVRTWYRESLGGPTPPTALTTLTNNAVAPASETPGQALIRGVYSWIRTLGARPDRVTLTNALNANLPQVMAANGTALCGGPAPTACLLRVQAGVNRGDDARFTSIVNGGANQTTAYYTAFGYIWSNTACPANTPLVSYNRANGDWTTGNGRSLTEMCQAQSSLYHAQAAGACAMIAGMNAPGAFGARAAWLANAWNYIYQNGYEGWAPLGGGMIYIDVDDGDYWAGNAAFWYSSAIGRAGNCANNGHNKAGEASCAITNFAAYASCGVVPIRDGAHPNRFIMQSPSGNQVINPATVVDMVPNQGGGRWTFGPDCNASAGFTTGANQNFNYKIVQVNNPFVPISMAYYPQAFAFNPGSNTWQLWDYNAGNLGMEINAYVWATNPPNINGSAQCPLMTGPYTTPGIHPPPGIPSGTLSAGSAIVFYFLCRGDASNPTNGGQNGTVAFFWQDPSGTTSLPTPPGPPVNPTYAFSNNTLNNGQYLYIATNGLVTTGASGTRTFWTIIARNQVADLDPTLNNPVTAQAPNNWCNTGPANLRGTAPNLGGNGGCPMEAFHFRIGCPLPQPCDLCCNDINSVGQVALSQGCNVPNVPGGYF